MDLRVTGADKLGALAKDLKAAEKDIKRESMKALRDAGKPAGEAVREAYGRDLPQRGGLAAKIRRSTISVLVRTTGRSIGAKVNLRNQHDLRSIESGRLRHPVFGNRGTFVEQQVPAEIGGREFEKQAPAVQRAMLRALDRVADRITKG